MPLANHLTLSICHISVKHIFSSLGFLSSTFKPLTLCILPKRHRLVNATAIHFTRPTQATQAPHPSRPPVTPLSPHRKTCKSLFIIYIRHNATSSSTPKTDPGNPLSRRPSAVWPIYYLAAGSAGQSLQSRRGGTAAWTPRRRNAGNNPRNGCHTAQNRAAVTRDNTEGISPSRTRTYNLAVNSRSLYRLSYRGI